MSDGGDLTLEACEAWYASLSPRLRADIDARFARSPSEEADVAEVMRLSPQPPAFFLRWIRQSVPDFRRDYALGEMSFEDVCDCVLKMSKPLPPYARAYALAVVVEALVKSVRELPTGHRPS